MDAIVAIVILAGFIIIVLSIYYHKPNHSLLTNFFSSVAKNGTINNSLPERVRHFDEVSENDPAYVDPEPAPTQSGHVISDPT